MKEKLKKLKDKTKKFLEKHKKGIALGVTGIATVLGAITIRAMSESTNKENYSYSNKFFADASDEELAEERERVRVKRNSCYDNNYDLYNNLLIKFDDFIVKRANKKYEKETVYNEMGKLWGTINYVNDKITDAVCGDGRKWTEAEKHNWINGLSVNCSYPIK